MCDEAAALQNYSSIWNSFEATLISGLAVIRPSKGDTGQYTKLCELGAARADNIVSEIKGMQSPLPLIMAIERIAEQGELTAEDVGLISRLGRLLGGVSLSNDYPDNDGLEGGVIENEDGWDPDFGMSDQDPRPDILTDDLGVISVARADMDESNSAV